MLNFFKSFDNVKQRIAKGWIIIGWIANWWILPMSWTTNKQLFRDRHQYQNLLGTKVGGGNMMMMMMMMVAT